MVDGLPHQQHRTMNKAIVSSKMLADYEERRNALLTDGYRVRHETVLNDGVICRLHHMSNGNDIVLSAKQNELVQKTNRIIVHRQFYDKTCEMCES